MGVGLSGFGGVLPFARRRLVEQKRWLTPLEITELLSVAQFLPGANVINLTIGIGTRLACLSGGSAVFAGLIFMLLFFVMQLGMINQRYGVLPLGSRVSPGLSAADAAQLVDLAGLHTVLC